MILDFSGVNYTGWLYIVWLPGYLQAEQGFSLAKTGWVAAIPFLAAAVGMWVNGIVVDRLAKKGYDLAKTRKTYCLWFDDVGIRDVAGCAIFLTNASGGVYLNSAVLCAFRGNICMGTGSGDGV